MTCRPAIARRGWGTTRGLAEIGHVLRPDVPMPLLPADTTNMLGTELKRAACPKPLNSEQLVAKIRALPIT